MSDRPISDSALSIVREMCDTVHPDIHLPALIVKEMLARIDQQEAAPSTFDDAMNVAGQRMAEASEALNLAMAYAQDECPDTLPMFKVASDGLREVSQAIIEIRAFR